MTARSPKGAPCPNCGAGHVVHDTHGFRLCRTCFWKWRQPK